MNRKTTIVEISDSWMYLTNKKPLWYELVENWILFWILYAPITLLPFALLKDRSVMYRAWVILWVIWALTFIRRYIKYLSVFILLNITVIAAAFFTGSSIVEKLAFVPVTVVLVFISFKKRYEEHVEFFDMIKLIYYEAFLAICYIISFNLGLALNIKITTASGIIVALTSIVYIHLVRIQKLMEWEEKFAEKFSKRIRKLKITFSVIISGVLLFFIWLLYEMGIFQLLDTWQSWLNSKFKLQESVPQPPPFQKNVVKNQNGDMNEMLKALGNGQNDNLLIRIILKVFEFTAIVITIVAVAYLLWLLILKLRELYKQFYSKSFKEEEKREIIISAEDITKEFSEGFRKIGKEIRELFERSNKKKIRKLYQRIVEKDRRQGIIIEDSNTPGEIETILKNKRSIDLTSATKIYEKARYSQHDCIDEDVEKMKQYL